MDHVFMVHGNVMAGMTVLMVQMKQIVQSLVVQTHHVDIILTMAMIAIH